MTENLDRIGIIQLGGKGVVGSNMIAVEYQNEILVLDAGIMFPTDNMPGVDYVIPDITYLQENKQQVKALLLSHGHEDHIGAVPFLISEINIPIYGTELTIALVKEKLKENKLLHKTELNQVQPREKTKINNFQIQFINVSHSIPDAAAISITTPVGQILYTGDFKIDQNPINDDLTDFYKLAHLGEEGLLALLSDSTNAEQKGYSRSESSIGKSLQDQFRTAQGKIIAAAFSSHIHRLQQVVSIAKEYDRKVAISGRSMIKTVKIARKLGHLDLPAEMLIDINDIDKYNPEQVVILMTGSQGEPMAALTRIARGDHRQIEVTPQDTVIISATPIPGNEVAVSNTINQLLETGADVIYYSHDHIHVSGHGFQEELKLMLNLTKPQYFIPVHGEYRHLHHHALLAQEIGIPKENIFVTPNGIKLELTKDEAKITDKVPTGKILIDGSQTGSLDNTVLEDRQSLSEDGIITVMVTIDRETDRIIGGPDLTSRGVTYQQNSQTETLLNKAKSKVAKILDRADIENIDQNSKLKSRIKAGINSLLRKHLNSNPVILPLIMEV
ncbi:ribonuclease J [Acetohalobium arabaticum]|uniref:Ribonuclease J n=1 Tax=Acetohalobium arabaticum (strain ATCC 49924 / DSM 5501 / Z-7288) TaxID=574087 RepID=D9QSU2_ACEAZ|nr:ribonuclease J [Acetohalobium arabaticum]ADL11630.1 RNA-metabolising metallo-beta-lactamase [Acetohalobium arabaticum DSM 5501]